MTPEDPLNPDTPEADEGEQKSIEERAASNGHVEEDDELSFALDGDKQLTLAGLGPRNTPIESEVSLMSASVPVRGLIDPGKQGQLLVSYVPAGYRYVPIREGQKIVKWKLRQYLRIMYVEQFVEAEAVETGAHAVAE